jgi:hypothetical protein
VLPKTRISRTYTFTVDMGPRRSGTGAGGRILGRGGSVFGSSLGSGVGRGMIGGGGGVGTICADTTSGRIQTANRTSVVTTSPVRRRIKSPKSHLSVIGRLRLRPRLR